MDSRIFLLAILFVAMSVALGSGGRRCSKPKVPSYGFIKAGRKNVYRVGSVVVYSCKRGYKLHGRSTAKCITRSNSALWNQRVPICKKIIVLKACNRLRDPSNGDVKLSGLIVGSKAKYTCDRGFKLKGNSVRKCQTNRRWSGSKPVCIRNVVKCPKLSDPRNGDVDLSGLRVGARAKYSCDSGFRLRGNQIRKCKSSGRWSGSNPFCQKKVVTCPRLFDPRNGDVDLRGLRVGAKAKYSCDRGFKLRGNQIRKCQSSGQWSGGDPFCQKIKIIIVTCSKLSDPQNGDVDLNGIRVGSKAKYSCDDGFKLRGNQVRKCQFNGQWSGSDAVCEKIIRCPSLSDPRNGDVDVSGLSVGSKASYSCDPGFDLQGGKTRNCQSNGQWSGLEPVCIKRIITCDPLSDPANGVVTLSGVTVGSIATYSCDDGFDLEGNEVRTCQNNGQWSGMEPSCREIMCEQLFDPQNGQVDLTGTTVGSSATYDCNNGFELQGDDQRTCQPDGQWSGDEPVCEEIIMCEQLFDPQNGQVDLTGTTVGSSATYKCNDGFELQGDDQRTCQPDGQWSGDEPVCEEIIMCEELSDPQNGQVGLTGTTVGSSAIYNCDDGFQLQGDVQRTCQPDGEWSGEEPVCQKIVLCELLQDPKNGQVDLDGVFVGGTASYTCNQGFELVGDDTRTCQPDGQWTGDEPVCKATVCEDLFPPAYGQVNLNDVPTVGSTAVYSCDVGFKLNGNKERTCQSNGQWTGSTPSCEAIPVKCPPLPTPKYGQVHVSGFSVDSTAQYMCDEGYIIKGSTVLTCLYTGSWSGVAPVCIYYTPGHY